MKFVCKVSDHFEDLTCLSDAETSPPEKTVAVKQLFIIILLGVGLALILPDEVRVLADFDVKMQKNLFCTLF